MADDWWPQQVGDLCAKSPGLFFPNRRVEKNCRQLVKRTSRCVRKGSTRRVNHVGKGEICIVNTLSHARIYVFYFPKKAFTPSHGTCFLLIFIAFECEGLDFQVFTLKVNACEGLKHQAFTQESSWQSGGKRYKRLLSCEYLKIQAFTLKTYDFQRKRSSIWRNECFFRG